jgi:CheY-like chemotaxis protein
MPVQTDAKLRILVNDDDHDTAEGLMRLLRHMGFDSRACYTGLECLACLEDFKPQIVLLDLCMPEFDGFEVAKRIRESPSLNRPVLIALTGYGRQVDRERTADAGFAVHLLKPALAGDIKAAIEQACRLLPGWEV